MTSQKRLLALVLTFLLVISTMTVMSFATDQQMISISSDWQGSVFGDVGGQNKITYENFEITENSDGTVKLRSSNNRGKMASSSEGIAYYYKEVPADANFEFSATATVESFDINNQVSFGLMLRDKVPHNESTKENLGSYLAVGPINAAKDVAQISFHRIAGSKMAREGNMVNEAVPGPGSVYDLSIRKSGNIYVLQFGNEKPVIIDDFDAFAGSKVFAGLYTSRNTTVTFSNIDIKVDTRKVSKLKVDSSSIKTEYLIDENLDLSGLKVTAIYSDGSEEVLSQDDYIVAGFDSSVPGNNTITINYNGAAATVDLTINSLTCTALEIKYFPAKMVYYKGDQFDAEGFAVIGIYNDGYKVEELTRDQYAFSISGKPGEDYIFHTAGTKTVTVTSTETPTTQTTFDVVVKNARIIQLEIGKLPEKTLYFIGDELDLDGMTVYAKYTGNNKVRLMKNEYTVSPFDSSSPGQKEVIISHKGEKAVLKVTVKEKEMTGIEVTNYPKTTYYIGENFDSAGIEVSKVYDNLDKEVLVESDYVIDSSAFDNTKVGTYDIKVVPVDNRIAPTVYKVTVREKTDYEWKITRFGQSTKESKNYVNIKEDGSIEIAALDGGGKITGDHDGITFYYTEIDAEKDNFVLSADIKVINYAKKPHDGQESFGIMARDAIGQTGDSSIFASNIAAVGGHSGGTQNPNGTQLFIRTGVKSPDGAGSQGVQRIMLKEEKPELKNTYPAAEYRLTLAKTNSGYTAKLNDGEQKIFYEPDILNVQNSKIYVGFYAARVAHIEVSNIEFVVTAAQTDAPKVEPPEQPVTPTFEFLSLDKTSKTEYNLMIKSNVNGTVIVKQERQVIAQDTPIQAGKILAIPTNIAANSNTNFSVTFLPDDTQYLSSYEKMVDNFTVIMKSYVENGDIYVSPTGTKYGTGTVDNPLDLDTAISFVRQGQKILLLDGRYVRDSILEVQKYNDGTAEAMKYLVAAPGARPVVDFDKKSAGVIFSGHYWYIKGIDFARSAGNTKGFHLGGSHNVIESCRFYENGDTGLQISRTDIFEHDKSKWPSYNLILNCESFDNRDPSDNNADGFAAKLTSGEGNVFKDCTAHNNIDDGWDLYTKAGTGAIGAVVLDGCTAYDNGFLTDGTVGNGDKNGFKLGGEGIHVPHVIKNSIAYGNGAFGFTSNSNPGVIVENCIAYNNKGGNLNLTTYSGITPDFKLNDFISYRIEGNAEDNYPEGLSSDTTYLYNGSASVNGLGVELTLDHFIKHLLAFLKEK